MSFQSFKKASQSQKIDDLAKALESLNKPQTNFEDDRMWSIQRDKTGNGYAQIRFLPAPEGEDAQFISYFSHSFRGPGGAWYIENCPTTHGGKCPVCEANSVLWKTEDKGNQDIARSRKRKLSYISNIYVIKDPLNPENEGKVFLFRYGKKIFDKIQECIKPLIPGQIGVNPFDFWKGCDFNLMATTIGDYANYDKSAFAVPSPFMGGDDKKLEAIWKKEYPLQPFIAADKFKSYDVLETKFNQVMGVGDNKNSSSSASSGKPSFGSSGKSVSSFKAKAQSTTEEPPFEVKTDSEDDDAMAFLKKLGEEN